MNFPTINAPMMNKCVVATAIEWTFTRVFKSGVCILEFVDQLYFSQECLVDKLLSVLVRFFENMISALCPLSLDVLARMLEHYYYVCAFFMFWKKTCCWLLSVVELYSMYGTSINTSTASS